MSTRIVTGVDIVEIERIDEMVRRWGPRFLERVYTEEEIAQCRDRSSSLAGRFAAKEAVSKALGTGMRIVSWRDIEVLGAPGGKPAVTLHGRARERANQLGVENLEISISHSSRDAVALAVGWGEDE